MLSHDEAREVWGDLQQDEQTNDTGPCAACYAEFKAGRPQTSEHPRCLRAYNQMMTGHGPR